MFTKCVFSIYFLISLGLAADFPKNFPKCKQIYKDEDAPQFKKCFIESSEKAREFLQRGIPELGIPSVVGLVVPSITIEQKTRVLQFKAILKNVTINGLDDYKITSFRTSIKNLTYWVTIDLPYINLQGFYYIDGRIFDQNVNQKGNFHASLNDTKLDIYFFANLYEKKGKEYANLTVFIDPNIGTAVGSFDGLFGDNQALNKATNAFLEQSTTSLLEAAKPDIVKLVNGVVQELGRVITQNVPWSVLFPTT